MSAQTDAVRLIIADFAQYVSSTAVGDGFTTEFPFPYAPVISPFKVYLNGTLSTSGYSEDDNVGVVVFTQPVALGVTVDFSSQTVLLTDAQITTILSQFPNSDTVDIIFLAAAICLDIIASSQALIQKKMKLLDQETDGPSLASALREHAKELRRIVKEGDESDFQIIEQINDLPGYVEKVIKDTMRDQT